MGMVSLPSRLTAIEKTNYRFKNWRHATAGTVVFTGCSFPSYFPKTLAALENALRIVPGVSSAIDCCGLPLAELKSPEAYHAELSRVGDRLVQIGAREVIQEYLLAAPEHADRKQQTLTKRHHRHLLF